MTRSLAFIILIGLFLSFICKKIKLPSIVGMLSTGVLLGLIV